MASRGQNRTPRKQLTQKRLRVLPYFTSLAVITGLIWLIAVGGTGFKDFPTPKLGLDLQGGLSMTLSAHLPDGGSPDGEQMDQARQILENRVNGTGVAEPEVYVEGGNNIVVNVADKNSDREALRDIGAPAELRFRLVSQNVPDLGEVDPDELADQDDDAEDTDGTAEEGDTARQGASAELQAVYDKLGAEALTTAEGLTEPASDAATLQLLEPFAELTGEEVALLPPTMQFNVALITCAMLNERPPGSAQQADAQVVACNDPDEEDVADGSDGFVKYLLDPARVVGDDVDGAGVSSDPRNPNYYAVDVNFTSGGGQKWGALTQESVGQNVAIVLDNTVISAPTIQDASSASTQITGNFSADEANLLAEQLKYGALPAAFEVETIDEVSATLGTDQLRAGLIAGSIGLILVVIYCFMYYRILGVVVLGSLVVAAGMLYPAVALLGEQIGFTLTLAGVAGFIVAIGITADSFVVFFERLKDEMRDGRTARSAVPRGWTRARRTIMSANVVSIMASVVLYYLAIGAVKGFAFALGLSTLINIAVVFLLTHPLVSLLSRGRLLNSARLSGLHSSAALDSDVPAGRGAVAPVKES